MRCLEKSIIKHKVYQYCKKTLFNVSKIQTNTASAHMNMWFLCAPKTRLQVVRNKHLRNKHRCSFWLSFLISHNNIQLTFILQQRFSSWQEHRLFHIRNILDISYYHFRLTVLRSNLTSVIKQFNIFRIFLLVRFYSITTRRIYCQIFTY